MHDIVDACRQVRQFCENKDLDDYLQDPMLQAAVERKLLVIGEALGQAVKLDPSITDRITGVRQAIAFRNRLVHAYSEMSEEVVWGVVRDDIPVLQSEVVTLLREYMDSLDNGQ